MFYYAAIFVFLRTFLQFVCDDYVSKSEVCENLVKKACAETLPDIRSAYFLKVIEIDNQALSETLNDFKVGFLFSNASYASEQDIIDQACHMSYMTSEFLHWTSGVIPLFAVWCFYKLFLYTKSCRKKPMTVVEIQEPEIEMTSPPKDKPPRTPLYVPRNVLPEPTPEQPRNAGIRRRRDRPKRSEEADQTSVLDKLTSLSPSLKNRIMNDPIV